MESQAQVLEDCFGVLPLFSDGSICRANENDIDFGEYNKNTHQIVEHQLCLRVYKPSYTKNNNSNNKKMPILFYLHGGGFCVGSRTWPNCHNCCLRLSSQLQFVIAPDYRLAPEHRLLAAIEDGFNAVKWLQLQAKKREEDSHSLACSMLLEHKVDFDKVFIMGDSSGGNLAHHLATGFGSGSPELFPIRINGYILLAPFFGGSLRTKSESQGPSEPVLSLESLDRFWRLSLPIGEGRDHPFANPFGPCSPNLEVVSLDPMLVIAGGKEIMKDRVKDYVWRLKKLGKDITYAEFEGQFHGFFTHNPCSHASNQLFQLIKRFIFAKNPF